MTALINHSRILTLVLAVVAIVASASLSGCDILGVSNPNNLKEEDLSNPAAAGPMANGSQAVVTRAIGAALSSYSVATDELTWIGSRDAWNQLDVGDIDDPANEFSDAAFPYVGEARWTTDEYIKRVEEFRSEDLLTDTRPLIRLYLYGAIIYTTIADLYDDFVIASDREEAGPPIGAGSMDQLYDTAIDYATKGLAISDARGDDFLAVELMGVRARAHYSKALWAKVNPVNTSSPLVNNANANADAQAALDMAADFSFALNMDPSLPDLVVGDLSMAEEINSRAELGFGETYIQSNTDGTLDEVTFEDPVTGDVDGRLRSYIETFAASGDFADIPVVSSTEMHLILAEAALAGNGSFDFTTQINAARGDAASFSGQISELDMLKHERRVNLYLQGRRLADHYRFGDPSPEWESPDAPGTFLPIAITEIRANPNVSE